MRWTQAMQERMESLVGIGLFVADSYFIGNGSRTIAFESGLYESEVEAIIHWLLAGE